MKQGEELTFLRLQNNFQEMKDLLSNLIDFEDKTTKELFEYFGLQGELHHLTRDQLLKILRWKSLRPLKQYEKNSEKSVKEITSLAFKTNCDTLKIHILTALSGVNYPTASAILMFYDKKKYPVLDFRVWTQLHKKKLVDTNKDGKNFTLNECEKYFQVIRQLAKDLGITARQVEKRIFEYDKEINKQSKKKGSI